jgi:hypothetical protein
MQADEIKARRDLPALPRRAGQKLDAIVGAIAAWIDCSRIC